MSKSTVGKVDLTEKPTAEQSYEEHFWQHDNGGKLCGNMRYLAVRIINHQNVIQVHSDNAILPVLTSRSSENK